MEALHIQLQNKVLAYRRPADETSYLQFDEHLYVINIAKYKILLLDTFLEEK